MPSLSIFLNQLVALTKKRETKNGMELTLGMKLNNNKTSYLSVKPNALRELIEEIDEDGSGLLEFGEFCQLAAKFLVEEDEEALKKELKEAFRIYDKEGISSHSVLE